VGEGSSFVVWFAAPGFVQIGMHDDGGGLVIEVETMAARVGCWSCGVIAKPKDRRWVRVRDVPAGDRSVEICWRKRVWECADTDCEVRTWTEQRPDFVLPRHGMTVRAEAWVCERVRALEGTPASCARRLGVTWSTAWSAVVRHGRPLIEEPGRVGVTDQVGFDETVMSPAHRGSRRRFITAVVDVRTGQILDVFEGRDRADLHAWLASRPAWWAAGVDVVSIDPHEGYRSAVKGSSVLDEVTIVVDPFHIVRLANAAVTKCRQRVQQETTGHRGRKNDPLYKVHKLLLMGAERVDERGWKRINDALRYGDPDGLVQDCWVAKEYVRDIYLTNDRDVAATALDTVTAWCVADESGPELRTLAKTLTAWRTAILAHHDTGASNGRTEAANLLIKAVKRSGRGFRNLANYRLRILLAGGLPRETQTVTRLRARPRLIA
jgi:transposase